MMLSMFATPPPSILAVDRRDVRGVFGVQRQVHDKCRAVSVKQFNILLLFLLSALLTTACHRQAHAADLGCTADGAQSFLSQTPVALPKVAAQTTTTFLAGNDEGEMIVAQKFEEQLEVHVFRFADVADVSSIKELKVLFVTPAPASADGTLIKFETPRQAFFPPWAAHHLLVFICKNGEVVNTASIRVWVSNPNAVGLICVFILLGAYLLFALAAWRAKDREHPLATKYPAYNVAPRRVGLRSLDPVFLTADSYNKGNIQRLQVLLFTFIIAFLLMSFSLKTGVLSELSGTVAGLLGISAVGAAVGQATTSGRERLTFENWTWLVHKRILPLFPLPSEEGPSWGDLVMTSREFDVYKLQTLVFSAVVAITLLARGETVLSTFTVPETLLGILGLSQLAYVAGVLVRPPAIKDLDEAITKLRKAEANLQTVVDHSTDTDPDGKLPGQLPQAPSPLPPLADRLKNAKNASRVYENLADQVELMFESTFEKEVDRKKLGPAIA
jgi:hypothetical protein